MPKPKHEDEPEVDDAPAPDPEPTKGRDVNKIAKDVADETRGKYEAEMIGDSTLVIRYADGTSESYTVDRVER